MAEEISKIRGIPGISRIHSLVKLSFSPGFSACPKTQTSGTQQKCSRITEIRTLGDGRFGGIQKAANFAISPPLGG
jgi:hypothetical protein